MGDITPEKVANFTFDNNDIMKRQKAMDAFEERFGAMNNLEMKKKQLELNGAKLEKMDADIFKTRSQAQATMQKYMPKAAGANPSAMKPSVGGDAPMAPAPPAPQGSPPMNLTAAPKTQEQFDAASAQTVAPKFSSIGALSNKPVEFGGPAKNAKPTFNLYNKKLA